jgi:hypothetical protein
MVDIFEDEQTLLNNRMALLAFDVGDKTYATSIMFISRIVQTLRMHSLLHYFSMSLKDSAEHSQFQPQQLGSVSIKFTLLRRQILNGDRVIDFCTKMVQNTHQSRLFGARLGSLARRPATLHLADPALSLFL